jgi:hypothetical protein
LIRWLLEQLEKDPTTLFSKQELLSRSREGFERLKQKGLLVYVQTDPEGDTCPCRRSCARVCPMRIVEIQGQFYAICPEDSEIDPVPLGEDDLHKYDFSVARLLEGIRGANRLGGSLSHIEPDYHYVGYTTCDERRVGLIFVPSLKGKGLLELCGLRRACIDDDLLVVFSPVSAIDDISIRAGMGRERIIQVPLVKVLDRRTLKIPVGRLMAQAIDAEREWRRVPQTRIPGDELISLTEAGELLGVNKGTACRYADAGEIMDNHEEGPNRKVWKSSVLLFKQRREDGELLQDVKELRKDGRKIPDKH